MPAKKQKHKYGAKNVDEKADRKPGQKTSSDDKKTIPEDKKIVNAKQKNFRATDNQNKALKDETTEQESQYEGRFMKRKIISNWDQYTILDEGEEQKGEDIEKLLSASGGVHFRFRDEETLEADQGLIIDHSRLTSLLEWLPLHQRLDLQPTFFSKDELDNFNHEALEKSRICLIEDKTAVTRPKAVGQDTSCFVSKDISSIKPPLELNEDSLSESIEKLSTSPLTKVDSSHSEGLTLHQTDESNSQGEKTKPISPGSLAATSIPPTAHGDASELEEWLDGVLDG